MFGNFIQNKTKLAFLKAAEDLKTFKQILKATEDFNEFSKTLQKLNRI